MSSEIEAKKYPACARSAKWREDFPIEWDGDHYVTRREMVKFLTLGSLLLASANWVTVVAGKLLHRGSKLERHIGPVSDLDRDGSMLFRYPTEQDPCIAVRTPEAHAGGRARRLLPGVHAPLLCGRLRQGRKWPVLSVPSRLVQSSRTTGSGTAYASIAAYYRRAARRSALRHWNGGVMSIRSQGTTLFAAILVLVAAAVVLQLWLLTVSMEALLAGEVKTLVPAAAGSTLLLVANAGLLRYVFRFDRDTRV